MAAQQPMSLVELAQAVEGADDSGDLAGIRHAAALAHEAGEQLTRLVGNARGHGVSWQAIGDELGVSRQAAFKRFDAVRAQRPVGENPTRQPVDLISRTVDVFTTLAAGNYEAVKAQMTSTCARALSKRRLLATWKAATDAAGALEACDDLTAQTLDGRTPLGRFVNQQLAGGTVVQATLRHEAGNWLGRVAYNSTGKITGILIAPLGATDLAF